MTFSPQNQKIKRQPIAEMFNGLVGSYDFLNHILSVRRDIVWRRGLANRLQVSRPSAKVLDLATGTGDQIIHLKARWPQLNITGLDFSQSMLELARPKLSKLPDPPPDLILGDALKLPFENETFEAATISFGLRNIPKRAALYEEVLRVLKPGGQFMILEMYFDRSTLWSPLYYAYLNGVIPRLGSLFSKQKEAYKYLAASIMNFPEPLEIKAEMALAGFNDINHHGFTFNTTMLVWGHKDI